MYQLLAEFRALRASVIKLWSEQVAIQEDAGAVEEIARFNDGIDRVLMDSISAYTAELDQSREIFLGVLGHDLRDPLNAMQMSASVIQLQAEDSAIKNQANTVIKAGKRMESMLGDLLDLTRTRLGGELPLKPVPIAFHQLADTVVEEQRSAHPNHNLTTQIPPDLEGVWDILRLQQLLANLLTNAIKHGNTDTPVKLVANRENDQLCVEVHNQGEPIPAHEQRTIFDPLMRLQKHGESNSSGAGIGLGLYICRVIAEAHGGDISVASSEAGKTCFRVNLPMMVTAEMAGST